MLRSRCCLLAVVVYILVNLGNASKPPGRQLSSEWPSQWHSQAHNQRILVLFRNGISSSVSQKLNDRVRAKGASVIKVLPDVGVAVVDAGENDVRDISTTLLSLQEVERIVPDLGVAQLSDTGGGESCGFLGELRFEDVLNKGRIAMDSGASVINLSLGVSRNPGTPNDEFLALKRVWREALLPLVRYARKRNALIVLSAGNGYGKNDDQLFQNPVVEQDVVAWEEHVIIVGSVDKDNVESSFSDKGNVVNVYVPGEGLTFGKLPTHDELLTQMILSVAPHVTILPNRMIAPGAFTSRQGERPFITQTMTCSGSSFAAAHVSAVSVLIWAASGGTSEIKAAEVKQLLISKAKRTTAGAALLSDEQLKKAEQNARVRLESVGARGRIVGIVDLGADGGPDAWLNFEKIR